MTGYDCWFCGGYGRAQLAIESGGVCAAPVAAVGARYAYDGAGSVGRYARLPKNAVRVVKAREVFEVNRFGANEDLFRRRGVIMGVFSANFFCRMALFCRPMGSLCILRWARQNTFLSCWRARAVGDVAYSGRWGLWVAF